MQVPCGVSCLTYKHDVVGRVDGAGRPVDLVRDRDSPPEDGVVLDVVHKEAGVVQHLNNLTNLLDCEKQTTIVYKFAY
jgi:hypothetical protein